MKKEQFAELLNGRQYRSEITKDEEKQAKENGLLVCFGASDDLLEFRGFINDEISAWEGTTALIVKKKGDVIDVIDEGTLKEINSYLNEEGFDELNIPKIKIQAEWCPSDLDCSWRINSEIPFSSFDIMEDDELYCRGIVIEKWDIKFALLNNKLI